MTNKINLNQNSSEPSGNRMRSDMAEAELKKPYLSFENTNALPGGRKGRGDKREVTKRIDEFFPRGAAGRRTTRQKTK